MSRFVTDWSGPEAELKSLALRLGAPNLPGMTMTGRLQSLIDGRAQNQGVPASEIAEQMKSEIPAGRFAEPREAGAAIAFLASPAAGYINGINLPVDGGRTPCL